MRVSILAVLALSLCASAANAEVLFSWEQDAQGWQNVAGYSTIGATDGQFGAMVRTEAGWRSGFRGTVTPQAATIQSNDTLTLDVTPLAPAPAGASVQVAIQMILNDGDHSYVSAYQTLDWGTNTVEFYYGDKVIPASIGWSEIRVITNTSAGYDPGYLVFDNFQAVPEPATMGLLGLGAMAALRRRR